MSETKELLRRGVGDFEPMPDAFERVLVRRDRKHRNQRVAAGVLGIAVFTLAAIGFARLLGSEGTPASDPQSPFAGTWVSTSDADGGTQTMTVEVFADDTVEIVVTDDVATVCSGTPSTMTGNGRIEDGTQLVIPAPAYTCDDGSEPETVSGPPLDEQLRDWTLVLDPETDTLSDGVGGVWLREGAEVPSPAPTASGQMWPQSNLEEVRQAQELADAGDPRYTWQVIPLLASWDDSNGKEPWGAEIFERFIRQELGWEEFTSGWSTGRYGYPGGGEGGPYPHLFIRCAPGRTNPLYPNDPDVGGCAPTIDDFRYETVMLTVEQPARRGPSGIWVVAGWEMLQPGEPTAFFYRLHPQLDDPPSQVEQLAPPSEAEIAASLGAFLQARIDGEGAEKYLQLHEEDEPPSPDEEVPIRYATTDGASVEEVPILYATTGGSAYERSEIERVDGPVWPTGWIESKVRLFAEDGTVVEQSFVVVRQENGRIGLAYGSTRDPISTTENGEAVPVPYSLLDGEVAFAAAPPWGLTSEDRTSTLLGGVGRGSASQFTMFMVTADPRPGMGCQAGPPVADVDALVRSIRSNPDLEATAPMAASVGGIDALRMDVVAPRPLEVGDCAPMVIDPLSAGEGPVRLYLLDLPEGMSARTLAIGISTVDSEFELVVEAAAPVLDSFEFHTP